LSAPQDEKVTATSAARTRRIKRLLMQEEARQAGRRVNPAVSTTGLL
jgi:hypothetical protein